MDLIQSGMGSVLTKLLFNAVALFAAAAFLKNVEVKDFTRAIITALLLSFLNATVGVILHFLAFPLKIVTLGLFSFVIDAVVLLIAAHFLKGFEVKGLGAAILLAILMAVFNSLLYMVY